MDDGGIPKQHVDLDRQFQLTDADPNPWADMGQKKQGWEWLLSHRVVALLAEAGSGKSHELRQIAQNRPSDAFFLRIENLVTGTFESSHDSNEQRAAFARWLQSDGDALFLLDAVDEAKLPRAKYAAPLRDALARVRAAIGDNLHRVRFVVTCRSSEWHGSTELEPVVGLASAMAKARQARDGVSEAEANVLEVTFAPLSLAAIDALGRAHGTDDGFDAALRESGALDHAITPLDVIHYADAYVQQRDRGGPGLPRTRRALASASIERRLAEKGATWTRSRLRRDEARTGAALLCFTLVMAQRSDLAFEEGANGLEAAAVLAACDPPWRPEQVRELLSTALFMPSGSGLVRLYRPEIMALLAAEHLDLLISKGLSEQRVIDDFFPVSFGRTVVARPHRSMLAWLASRRPAILRRMIEIAPEQIIEDGDPRALAAEDCVSALESHLQRVEHLAGGFYFSRPDLRRFAVPELERDVVRLLGMTPTGEGRLHLLQLIRAGRYKSAVENLVQLASDPFTPTDVRIYAMSALVECGQPSELAQCGQTLLAWGAPHYPSDRNKFAREREDDARHRLVRHGYPDGLSAHQTLRLLGQISGKRWTSNAKSLAAALIAAPRDDLGTLVVGLDALCFPYGNGGRPANAPPHSARQPDLFRALVALFGRAIRECPELFPVLVPIHGRCLRSIRWDQGHGFLPRAQPEELFDITPAFRLATLDMFAEDADGRPPFRMLEQILPSARLNTADCVAEAPALLKRYEAAGESGRRVFAEVLEIWTRWMRPMDRWRWRQKLRKAARHHCKGRDERTLAEIGPAPIKATIATYRRIRSDLPWKAEDAWVRLRHAADEKWYEAKAVLRHYFTLSDGRPFWLLVHLLRDDDTGSVILSDPVAARRRKLGSRLVRGAKAHARRHVATGHSGDYDQRDLLAFAGWTFIWSDDGDGFKSLPDDAVRHALGVALTSPLEWPAWATELAKDRPALFREEVLHWVRRDADEYRFGDTRVTPPVIGKVAEFELGLRALVAPDLVGFAESQLQPGSAAVRALRTICDADVRALNRLRLLARRRAREAVWEAMPSAATLWLAIWAAKDPHALNEMLDLTDGPLGGQMGSAAIVRALEPLLAREDTDADRLARPATNTLLRLAEYLYQWFPPEEDDHREGMRVRDDRRRAEEVRAATLNLLGERRDAEGRAALEDFIETYVRPHDPRWANAWLSGHAQDAAKPAPWPIEDAVNYGSTVVRQPTTADELLAAVLHGLRDIERDLATSEFDRRALFRSASETDVRAFLGHELDLRHREQYSVTQESETSRAKRPDLRCELRAGGDWVAVVEVKLVHGWTWDQLLDKLITQLLQQYVISDRVARGVYLLVDMGRVPQGTPPAGVTNLDDLMDALRDIVRTDARFEGRPVEVMRMHIAVPPAPSRTRKSKASTQR